MEIKQIFGLMNTVTNEILGNDAEGNPVSILQEDLSNIVDVGNTIQNVAGIDRYVKSLVDHIGKVIFVNRPYSGNASSVLMDGWEYGSILQKVTYDGIPEATENESWELVNGTSYDVNVFTQPKVSAKFFNKKVTFEVPMSFAERQVKSAFDNPAQLNAFFSMIYDAVDKSMTIKADALIARTINSMIASTIKDGGIKAVNLLAEFKKVFPTSTVNAENAIFDKEFIKFASLYIKLTVDRMTRISKLFNIGKKERFTPMANQHIILHSQFKSSASVYLESDTFHNELVALPNVESVPYWQGSGSDFSLKETTRINVKLTDGTAFDKSGILGIIFDRNALGVSNLDRRVTTNYNPKGEFFNNWYKFEAGYFNDFNENAVVFYVEDAI